MSIDFKRALSIPFSDSNWLKKVGIAVLFYLPTVFVSISSGDESNLANLLSILATILVGGYAISSANNEINNVEPILPEWDIVKSIVNSLKSWVINIAYSIILIPFGIIFIAVMAVSKALLPIFIILLIPITIFYLIFVNIAQSLFYSELKLADAFDFKRILAILKVGFGTYIVYFLWAILVGLIYGIGSGILSAVAALISKYLVILISSIATVLITLSAVNLLAQAYKTAVERLD